MKKSFLVVLLAVVLAVPALAQSKINLYGQFDVYGYQTDGTWGESGNAEGDSSTYMRALLGANVGLVQNIEGNVALLYGRHWGDTAMIGTTANSFLDTLKIAEANIVFNNLFDNDKVSAKIGRYFFGEQGDTMFYFGLKNPSLCFPWNIEDSYYESGIDGLLVTYNDRENLKVEAGYAKIYSYYDGDEKSRVSLFFAKANYKFNDMLSLQGYFFDYESGDFYFDYDEWEWKEDYDREKQESIGLKPQATLLNNTLNLSLEFVQQFYDEGETSRRFHNYAEAWFAKLDAKYNVSNNFDLRGMYFRSGENFNAKLNDTYLGLFTSWRALNYILRDSETLNIGADYTLNKFKFSADYFRFNANISKLYNAMYELDAQIQYNYTEDISFKLGASWIAFEDGGDEADVLYVFGGSWKFDTKVK